MKKEFVVSGKQFYIHEAMPLVTGDANCYELVFYAPCSLESSVFTVTAIRPDGEIFTAMGKVEGKIARYTLDNSMYAVVGTLKIRTVITAKDGEVLTANEISFEVVEGVNTDGAIEADTNYPVLNQLILKIEDAISAMPEIKELTEKAENAISDAETKAIFAGVSAEEAKNAAEEAKNVSEKAEWFMEKVNEVRDALPPTFTENDVGKILFLSMNGTVSEITSVSGSYEADDNIITDAGLLDDETAFIDICGAELHDLGIPDPMDERCAYAFQLMPDSLDFTTDFDVMAERVEVMDNAFRMIFPAEHCEPFAANNIQSASDLFAFFETVQLNAEYPKPCLTPVWGTEEEVLTPAYLDHNVISPAVSLAKEYTNEKTSFSVMIRDSSFGMGDPIYLDGITNGVKRMVLTLDSDMAQNPTALYLYYEKGGDEIEEFAGSFDIPRNLKAGDKIEFNASNGACFIYPADNPEALDICFEAAEFMRVLKKGNFNKIDMLDLQCMLHHIEVEYFVSAEYMVDSKIKSAIIESWEAAI